MTTVHYAIGVLLAAGIGATLLASLAGFAGPWRGRLVDRLLLIDAAALLLATATGPMLLVTGRGPADPLHFLYAALAWLVPAAARYLAAQGAPRRRATVMTVGCLLTAGVIARLFMTGS